jgi:hypothetical protein
VRAEAKGSRDPPALGWLVPRIQVTKLLHDALEAKGGAIEDHTCPRVRGLVVGQLGERVRETRRRSVVQDLSKRAHLNPAHAGEDLFMKEQRGHQGRDLNG